MVGITLTPEQIRSAPHEVRHWLEQELAASLGLRPRRPDADQPRRDHLVACSADDATAILRLIRNMLPVVNVFFELGRQGASFAREGLEAFRLTDIAHHTRLQSIGQVIACLDLINQAMQQVRGDADATLYAIDQYGDCFIAMQTQQSILQAWLQVVAGQVLDAARSPSERPAAASAARSQTDQAPSPSPRLFSQGPVMPPASPDGLGAKAAQRPAKS